MRIILLTTLAALCSVFTRADEATPVLPHALSNGWQVLSYEGAFYRIDKGDGKVAAMPAATEATEANAESDCVTSPPSPPAPVGSWTTLTFVSRFTEAEQAAIFTSADPQVIVARSLALAAQDIRGDDPRTTTLMELLVSKGLLTEERKTAILTP